VDLFLRPAETPTCPGRITAAPPLLKVLIVLKVTAEHELNEPLVLRDVIMPGLKMLDKNGREEYCCAGLWRTVRKV
jgi:hypothetical protein